MFKRLALFVTVVFLTISTTAQIHKPIKWDTRLKSTSPTSADILIRATIDEGWHLYGLKLPKDGPRATSIVFEKLINAKLVGELKSDSKLILAYDPNFDMELNWYAKEAVFIQSIRFDEGAKVTIQGYVEFMACNDQTCIPPDQESFSLGISIPPTPVEKADTLQKAAEADYWKPVIGELNAYNTTSVESNALWLIFLAGFVGGLLALFTPCVWPIIPMTVSFFLKRSGNKAKGRRDAMLYGLAIIVIYVVLGLLITLIFGASALNSLATNAVFNLLFFALLVVFAISFFGAFEITLPSSWANRLDAKAETTAGFVSILLMAFTLVIVSFSCTGPIIGTLLVEVSSTGSVLAPAIGMFGFALALSIPFSLFALFPSWLQAMPRSGGWLNSVKVVLAFLELALALKFLSVVDLAYGWGILDREVFLSLWIIIFTLLGMYLLGKIRFVHDSEQKHSSVLGVFLSIISLSFALYMVPGLWGAPLKAISAFTPPLYTQDFNLYANEVHPAFTDYDEGMKFAAQKSLPVVVDFTGYGCVNCRKMEASVWTDPEVKRKLDQDFVLISLYVDDKTPLSQPYQVEENGVNRTIKTVGDKWSYLQRVKFGANAQPFYVMLDTRGNPLTYSFAFDENPQNFLNWLNRK